LILPMSFTLMLVSPRAAGLAERYGVATLAPIGLTIMAVGLLALACFARLDSFWWVIVALVPMATGMALTMTPLTTLIMSTVPASWAGMGSALNDATRELGGALGVAVLGSVTTTVYVGQLPALGAFSPGARHETEAGLAGALSRASELGGGAADAFVDAARAAFVDGLSVSISVAAALAATAAVVARRFLPRPALPTGSGYEVATTPGAAAAAGVNPRSAGGAGPATPAGTPAG
jgi:hypothetical protein